MQAPFADPLSGLELQRKALPLVGREAEMQLMHALLDTVALNRAVGPRAVTVSGDIASLAYADRVHALSVELAKVPGVTAVISINPGPEGHGPKDDYQDPFRAAQQPFPGRGTSCAASVRRARRRRPRCGSNAIR